MSPALFTTGQSRWVLHLLVGLLSVGAIASAAPASAGGAKMFSGTRGDISGVVLLMGSVGLAGVLALVRRIARMFLPKPWRIYLDRIEFDFFSMLWIAWTSLTMAFSAFTIQNGVCSSFVSDSLLTCPFLAFNLALPHLLSTSNLALLLVILSTALSPSNYLSLSTSLDESDAGGTSKIDPDATDAFVMWDLALASPPSSPRLDAVPSSSARTYGTSVPTNPLTPADPHQYSAGGPSSEVVERPRKRDKFAEGRVWSYVPLGICSLGVAGTASYVLGNRRYVLSSTFMLVVALLSLIFSVAFLALHFSRRTSQVPRSEQSSFILRHDRALEVGIAGCLFLLWPLAAISYTMFPPTPNRPCADSPASAENSLDPIGLRDVLCRLSSVAVALAWLASWIILARVVGLIFPMPDMGKIPIPVAAGSSREAGEEAASLLRSEVRRPQVGYGRMVAGEAFELGGDDD